MLPSLLKLGRDPVPNVRLAVALCLRRGVLGSFVMDMHFSYYGIAKGESDIFSTNPGVVETNGLLQKDADRDVVHALTTA